jgi:hypothetical protein
VDLHRHRFIPVPEAIPERALSTDRHRTPGRDRIAGDDARRGRPARCLRSNEGPVHANRDARPVQTLVVQGHRRQDAPHLRTQAAQRVPGRRHRHLSRGPQRPTKDVVSTLTGADLKASMSLLTSGSKPTATLPASSTGVGWFDVPLDQPSDVPPTLEHTVTVSVPPGLPVPTSIDEDGGHTKVDRRAPIVIAPPLQGAKWARDLRTTCPSRSQPRALSQRRKPELWPSRTTATGGRTSCCRPQSARIGRASFRRQSALLNLHSHQREALSRGDGRMGCGSLLAW